MAFPPAEAASEVSQAHLAFPISFYVSACTLAKPPYIGRGQQREAGEDAVSKESHPLFRGVNAAFALMEQESEALQE